VECGVGCGCVECCFACVDEAVEEAGCEGWGVGLDCVGEGADYGVSEVGGGGGDGS